MLSDFWILCNLWSMMLWLHFSNEMTGDCLFTWWSSNPEEGGLLLFYYCHIVSPPSFMWEMLKGPNERVTMNLLWPTTSSYCGVPHLTTLSKWKESGFRYEHIEVFFQQKISLTPKISSPSSCLVLFSLVCTYIALKKSLFFARSSYQVLRSYQHCTEFKKKKNFWRLPTINSLYRK